MSNNPKILQIVNILAIIATIIVNAVVEIIPVNGVTSKDVSDFYPSLFTPPGWVFSIWSVIYTLLIIFMIYQALPSQREASYLKTTVLFFVIGGLINTSWLILFHYAYNATGTVQYATQDIPGWIPIIVVVVIGALLIGLVSFLRNQAR